mmetsp:Transcript_1718/g.4828  ORF Transcript_1718/g.4828 Transcript_1718/m.4828 type:complete len:241 (-) Transcript_1718:33-755(-)
MRQRVTVEAVLRRPCRARARRLTRRSTVHAQPGVGPPHAVASPVNDGPERTRSAADRWRSSRAEMDNIPAVVHSGPLLEQGRAHGGHGAGVDNVRVVLAFVRGDVAVGGDGEVAVRLVRLVFAVDKLLQRAFPLLGRAVRLILEVNEGLDVCALTAHPVSHLVKDLGALLVEGRGLRQVLGLDCLVEGIVRVDVRLLEGGAVAVLLQNLAPDDSHVARLWVGWLLLACACCSPAGGVSSS